MGQETSLAQGIRVMDDKAKYDAACKRLLSEKSILAWIMKCCLEEYQSCTIEEIVGKYITGTPTVGQTAVLPDETNAPSRVQSDGQEDTSLTEHTITYDIRFTALAPSDGEPIRLIINVEAQGSNTPGYPLLKRAIYYCSRMISAQYGTEFTNADYDKIKKVYSIWICLSPKKEQQNTITRYRMCEENMAGTVRADKAEYDLLTVIMLCLGDESAENYDGIVKLLSVLLSDKVAVEEKKKVLEKDFHINMSQTLETEVGNMCNLSELVEKRGEARGEARGETRALTESIRNLMTNLKLSPDEAMKALSIPDAERAKYKELLKK